MLRSNISRMFSLSRRFLTEKKPVTGAYGMTVKEMEDLRACWSVVDSAPMPVSKLFFKSLFEAHPEYEKKFGNFPKGIPLIHQPGFIPHMRAVVSALNKIIGRLEHEETVDNVVDYVVSSHAGRKVDHKSMEDMGNSIKATLKTLNRSKFTTDSEAAFDKFWKGFLQDYAKKLDKLPTKPIIGGSYKK